MRITFLISTMACGGAERVMATVTDHFVKRGDNVTLITFDDGKVLPFFPLNSRVSHVPLGILQESQSRLMGIFKNLQRLKIIRSALKRSEPEIVVSFLSSVSVLTVLASIGPPWPVIVSERDDPWHPTEPFFWRMARSLIYPFADKIVVHTEYAKTYFPKVFQSKILAIPNPSMTPKNLVPKDSYASTGVITSIGRLTEQKGFDVLIKAFALVSRQFPQYRLNILGEGPLLSALERLRDELNLKDKVFFLGKVEDVLGQLKKSDMFVLASRFEGFGNVLCEAMACGLPIVSTNASGPAFILREGKDGVLVPIEDADALAQAMISLIEKPEKREQFGKSALESVKRFGEEKILGTWEKLIVGLKGRP